MDEWIVERDPEQEDDWRVFEVYKNGHSLCLMDGLTKAHADAIVEAHEHAVDLARLREENERLKEKRKLDEMAWRALKKTTETLINERDDLRAKLEEAERVNMDHDLSLDIIAKGAERAEEMAALRAERDALLDRIRDVIGCANDDWPPDEGEWSLGDELEAVATVVFQRDAAVKRAEEAESILACTADKAAMVFRELGLGDMLQDPMRSFAVRDAISDIAGEIGVMRQNHLVAVDDLTERAEAAETQLAEARRELEAFRCNAHGAHNPECVGCTEELREEAEAQRDKLAGLLAKAATEYVEHQRRCGLVCQCGLDEWHEEADAALEEIER